MMNDTVARILRMTPAEFKRLRKALNIAASYGIPTDVALDYALAFLDRKRDVRYDRMTDRRMA